jgi:cation diffusion facilitator CzcD-associated flavoprotein CzcO
MVKRKRVCVIGAGVSGLASARAFRDKGHDVTVLERSHELGGVWGPARSYPGIRTQSPKDLYRYTGLSMPEEYPEWPSGAQVHAYLTDFAEKFGLLPLVRFRHTVTSMARGEAGGWDLTVEDDKGETGVRHYDFVVVASGTFTDPNRLNHRGDEEFLAQGGTILHSSEYTDPAIVRGRKVVVLGFSKSATDVAVNAVKEGAEEVTVVYLAPVWRVPYRFGGLVNFKHILYCRASEIMFPPWSEGRVAGFLRSLTKPLVWANWRALEGLLTLQFGLRKNGLRPKAPIDDTIACGLSIATEGFFELVSKGRIRTVQGTFERYEGKEVILSGGERIPLDVAIQAVGWKLGVPFLDDATKDELIAEDGQYRLYRLIANPDVPDLGFVGFNSSFATVLTSDLAAQWLVRYADGKLRNQPRPEDMRTWIETHLKWRRKVRPAARVYGGLCSAPYHFRHMDELLADIGARKTRRNPLAETFLPPDADAYARFLESAPDYAVS